MTSRARLPRLGAALWWCGMLLIAVASCRRGTPEKSFDGTWVMSVDDGRVLMVLMLTRRADGLTGSFSHPQKMQTDGDTFSRLGDGIVTERVVEAARQGSAWHVVVENPNNADKSEFDISLSAPDVLAVRLVGAPFEAWHFRRHDGDSEPKVAMDWDPMRTYAVREEHPVTPSPEMNAIFEQDQAARQSSANLSPAQWKAISRDDAARRASTRSLLERGQLKAAEDFRKAAFVFQHGSTPDDYLLAHTLALVALAKGDRSARWIAAATLDRYLHSVGSAQIYGTQFSVSGALKEPYDRKLIADVFRRSLAVPALAEQEEQARR